MKQDLNIQLFQKLEHARYLNRELDCWSARKLQHTLGYVEWRNFLNVIEKAKKACILAGFPVRNHFTKYNKSVEIGKGGRRKIEDVGLSRYACYLLLQNMDPAKNKNAFTQVYFSMQDRNLEVIEQRIFDMTKCLTPTKSEKKLASITYEQGTDQEGFRLIRSLRDQAFSEKYSIQDMKKKWSIPLRELLTGFGTTLSIEKKEITTESTSHIALEQEIIREYQASAEHDGNFQRIHNILIEHGLKPEECILLKISGKLSTSWKLLTKKRLTAP